MIEIVTSSWFTKLPPGHTRIGISRGVPRKVAGGYRRYPQLNPGPWFKSVPAQEYMQLYFQILADLDPVAVVADLADLAEGGVAVLVCFEPPPPSRKWCHRSLVSAWLADSLDMAVPELNHEALGYGWDHPLGPTSRKQGDLFAVGK
jgi:hypothetical protein